MFSGAKGGAVADGPDAHISDLFTRLVQSTEDHAHKRTLKICDDLLKTSPGDLDAELCKVIALIELGRYADAVEFLTSDTTTQHAFFRFEHAYALYKANRLEDALEMLDAFDPTSADGEGSDKDFGAEQLRAQLLYRTGKAEEAVELYQDLFERFPEKTKASATTAVNLTAALVAANKSSEITQALKKINTTPKASFELAFNVACGLLGKGEFTDALEYLTLAKTLGSTTLQDEGLGEDEIADELVPVDVQISYCNTKLGRKDAAVDGYKNVLQLNTSDHSTTAVAATNLATLLGPRGEGGADLLKKLEKLCDANGKVTDNVSALGSLQSVKQSLVHNRAVSLVHLNKLLLVKEMLPAVRDTCGVAVSASLEAAIATRERRPKDALTSLLAAEKDAATNNDKTAQRDALLTIAQLHASAGEYSEAVFTLKKVGEVDEAFKASPASTATIASLLDLAGDADGADKVLDEMLSRGGDVSGVPAAATLRAADRVFDRGRQTEALNAYEKLVSGSSWVTDEEKQCALAGVVKSAAALGDFAKAEKAATELTTLAKQSKALDPDSLEESLPASVVARAAEMEQKLGGKKDKAARQKTHPQKRKRVKKKILYPKNFDPQNPGPAPDPERWLPKRERASYKGKRKKVTVRGTQGAGGSSADLKSKEFSGGAGGGDEKGKQPVGLDPSIAEKLAGKGKKGKKKGKR